MPLLKKFGKFGDGCPAAARVAGDAQQKLVLLRGQSGLSRRSFAETEESSQFVAEPGKLPNRRSHIRGLHTTLRSHAGNYITV